MAKVSTNISIDADVKAEAQKLFAELGLDLSTAVNLFLKQSLSYNGIPFEVRLATPNEETKQAIEEGRRIARDPNVKGYTSIEELRADLGV